MIKKYTGPVSWEKTGNVTIDHIHAARMMLGFLSFNYTYNSWDSFQTSREFPDGSLITVKIINGHYFASIFVPPTDSKRLVTPPVKGQVIVYFNFPDNDDLDQDYYQEFALNKNTWVSSNSGVINHTSTVPEDFIGTMVAEHPETGQYFFGGNSGITCCGHRAVLYSVYNLFGGSLPPTETPAPAQFTSYENYGTRFHMQNTGLMPDIYSRGVHLCNAPQPLAGGTVVDGILVCVKHESIPPNVDTSSSMTLTFYYRPLLSEYRNDDLYDPDTNINGWKVKTVNLEHPLWMRHTIQFNGSGEQGIVNCGISFGDQEVREESLLFQGYSGYEVQLHLGFDILGDLTVSIESQVYQHISDEIPEVPTYGTTGLIQYPVTEINTPFRSVYDAGGSIKKAIASFADYHLSGVYENTLDYTGYIDAAMRVRYEDDLFYLNSEALRTKTSHIETSNWVRDIDPEYGIVGYDTYYFPENWASAIKTPKVSDIVLDIPSQDVTGALNFGLTGFPIPVDGSFNFTPRLRNPTFFMRSPANDASQTFMSLWGIPKQYADILFVQAIANGEPYFGCSESSVDIESFLFFLKSNGGRILYVSTYNEV